MKRNTTNTAELDDVKRTTVRASVERATLVGRTTPVEPGETINASAVPGFASYEELAKVPSRPMWVLRRGPLQRVFYLVLFLLIFKIAASPFLGKYGVYIVGGVGVTALAIILWRSFHRDPTEGVGIKLN